MDIRTQSALLASIVGIALGVSMLLRASRPRVLTRFALFALTVGGFYAAQFFHSLLAGSTSWPWSLRVADSATIILGALVPSFAISFFLEFLNVSRRSQRWGDRFAALTPVAGLAVALTPLIHVLWARIAVSVWVFLALFGSVGVLLNRMRRTDSRIERARLAYLAIGAGASIIFSATDLLWRFGIPFPTLGPIFTTLYLFFWSQTLLRLRLMDLQEFLGKVASQTVLAVILAAMFTVLTGWAGNNLPLFLFNTAVGAFVMLILMEPLREKVDEGVIALFFRERFELLRALSGLKVRIATVIEIGELARSVLDALHETRRVTHASIYLLADDRPGYRLVEHRGPQPVNFLDTGAARGLLNAVSSGQKAILLENLERRIADLRAGQTVEGRRARDELKRLNDMRVALGTMKAGICIPLVGNDRVIGFLNLWDERVPEAFASDEIAQLLEIAERIATVVENSKLYEKMRERDRLAALGEMAAGLAHEIRNPLGAIKGAAQCLDPKNLPGEDGEFLEVIVEEVNRLNGVVTAFLDYSRPLKQHFNPSDINEVVTRTIRLIQNDIPKQIELKMELSDAVHRVDADAEQLKQVLINLVQNAIQAIGEEKRGSIVVRTVRPERFSDFRHQDFVEIHVTDDGPGIPADQQLNIFVPFFTTKQKGTGLGLAICQRIVKNHGGNITVQSRVNEGTSFVIRLPALAESQPPVVETPAPEGTPYPGTLQPPALPEPQPKDSLPSEPKKKKEKKRRAS